MDPGEGGAGRGLLIDLNETPPTPPYSSLPPPLPLQLQGPLAPPLPPLTAAAFLPIDAYELACRYNAAAAAAATGAPKLPPAEFPGEAGVGWPPRLCGLCSRPELRGATLVCDACDVGFHVSCVQPLPQALLQPYAVRRSGGMRWGTEDWVCPKCEAVGARAQQPQGWGMGARMMIDINSVPPEDAYEACPNSSRLQNYSDASSLGEYFNIMPRPDAGYLRGAFIDGDQYNRPFSESQHCVLRPHFALAGASHSKEEIKAHRSQRKRKRSTTNILSSSKSMDNRDYLKDSTSADKLVDNQASPSPFQEIRSILKLPKYLEENIEHRQRYSNVELPIQYEDFFITNLGEIDQRATYHDSQLIWPVGYTSYWHDRITGSLFEFEVTKGGNAGPLFKVRRLPCSVFPLPNASTILLHNDVKRDDVVELKDSSNMDADYTNDMEDDILMLLTDPSQTNEDILACYDGDAKIVSDKNVQFDIQNHPLIASPANSERPDMHSSKEFADDKIGEIFAEGKSPSLVWTIVSNALINACKKLFNEMGCLQFCCIHNNKVNSVYTGQESQKDASPYSPLFKFSSSLGPVIPKVIQNDGHLTSACISLEEWLSQDRIGLDMEFVQEIIGRFPRSRDCSGYELFSNRLDLSMPLTVADGSLVAVAKATEHGQDEKNRGRGKFPSKVTTGPQSSLEDGDNRPIPLGHPISCRLPSHLSADVFQILEFLWRFQEVLGLDELPSYEELEEELIDPWPLLYDHKENLENDVQRSMDQSSVNGIANTSKSPVTIETDPNTKEDNSLMFIPIETASARQEAQAKLAAETVGRCSGVILKTIHASLLRVLIGEMLSKVVIYIDPNVDVKESKSRRNRKKEPENFVSSKEPKVEMLTINGLTWPELARRYVLAVASVNLCMDWSDITSRDGMKVFRCLHGDGGILCGAVGGVAGMETDAALLAGTEKQLYDSAARESKVLLMDYKNSLSIDLSKADTTSMAILPDWAKPLEPVRKLPTNVGTRIRKCVFEALSRNPPEWARKILEHSISKDVYKGNASGPTKKAVISVLSEASPANVPEKSLQQSRGGTYIAVPEVIMKKCRIALRRLSEETKDFCNLLASSLIYSNEIEDEGILGFPAMVSRPLDFRTIDLRLSHGAYCGSHESFFEDVREVIHNLRVAFSDRHDLLLKVETLSKKFESLYEKEVLQLVQLFADYDTSENMDPDTLNEIILSTTELPKAPWEDGVCKVCGVDKDDDSVLLCDTCDSEYHMYCLDPPLVRIPEGNWYCPSCIPTHDRKHVIRADNRSVKRQKKNIGAEAQSFHENIYKLAQTMEEMDYWDMSIEERILLLKFLCDEVLKTPLIREHIEQCADRSVDTLQKLRALNMEWRNLKYKLDFLEIRAAKGIVDVVRGEAETPNGNCNKSLKHEDCGQNRTMTENVLKELPAPAGRVDVLGCTVEQENGMNLECDDPGMQNVPLEGDVSARLEEQLQSDGPQQVIGEMSVPLCAGDQKINLANSNIQIPASSKMPSFVCNLSNDLIEADDRNKTRSGEQENSANVEMNAVRNSILQFHESGISLESQLMTLSLRRDCLGRDSSGRLYWSITKPGKRPYLISDGSVVSLNEATLALTSSDFVRYESDDQIRILINWLKESDPRERELKESISQWKRQLFHQEITYDDGQPIQSSARAFAKSLPITKASLSLQNKYGPSVNSAFGEVSKNGSRNSKIVSEDHMYRCDCLEAVWPARLHCLSCHQTFFSSLDFEDHNDKRCLQVNSNLDDGKDTEVVSKSKAFKCENLKVKDIGDQNGGCSQTSGVKACPYDLEEISKRFVVSSSNSDVVKNIGLLATDGIPSFVPARPTYLDPISLLNQSENSGACSSDSIPSLEQCQTSSSVEVKLLLDNRTRTADDDHTAECKMSNGTETSSDANKIKGSCTDISSSVPESSLRPVMGRDSQIMKQLKISLLDIEAALQDEAFKSSKSQLEKRTVWRSFLKSADSIYEIVQAVILLEGMIKSEYLKNDWWYWSSITAAVKTSTISSLALRIYALDDYIIYDKAPSASIESSANLKPVNKGKKRKEMEQSV